MYTAGPQSLASSLLSTGRVGWSLFIMGGVPPTTSAEIPFALNDMSALFAASLASVQVNAVQNTTYGTELLSFDHDKTHVPLKTHGVRIINGSPRIQCMPQSITTNVLGGLDPKGMVNTLEPNGREAHFKEHTVDGKYLEYDFGTPVTLEEILYYPSTANTVYSSTSVDIQYYDTVGETWQTAIAGVNVKVTTEVSIAFTSQTAQLWRVKFNGTTSGAIYPLRISSVRFLASELPANIMDKTDTPFTWGVLVPYDPNEAIYQDAGAAQIPALIVDVGGPLDGKPVVLNRTTANIDEPITCMHCKIICDVAAETV